MKTIIIAGYNEGNNYFVDSIAHYVRQNGYPEWDAQSCDIVGHGRTFNYLISRCDSMGETLTELSDLGCDDVMRSNGVLYKVDDQDFTMLIDGRGYFASL